MLKKTNDLINEFDIAFQNMNDAGFDLYGNTLKFENCTPEQNERNRSNIQKIKNLFVLFKEVLEDETPGTISSKLNKKKLPFMKDGTIKKINIHIIKTQFMQNLEKKFLHDDRSVSSFFNDETKTNSSIKEILDWFHDEI